MLSNLKFIYEKKGLWGVIYKLIRRPFVFLAKKNFFIPSKHDKEILVFVSKPDYADNSRALSDYLVSHNYLDKYRVCWFVSNARKYKRLFADSGVEFYETANAYNEFTLAANRILANAKYFFGTHGFPISVSSMCKTQHAIMLWHGCSFKDMSPQSNQTFFEKALVAGPLFVETKKRYWSVSEDKIVAKGYPRYDWLKCKTSKAVAFTDKIKGKCAKLIVWMPTFRNDKNGKYNECDAISQFPLMKNGSDWNRLDAFCDEKSVVLAVKLHLFQKDYDIDFSKLKNIVAIDNKDFENANISLYEFLATTDALLTDYSSVGVDYLVVDKPIGFTLDDYDIYRKSRGFVFDDPRPYMPGHHLYTIEDLLNFVSDVAYGKDDYAMQRMKMKNVAIYDSTCYSREIIDELGL